jgi:excisionase family DNA binding protein
MHAMNTSGHHGSRPATAAARPKTPASGGPGEANAVHLAEPLLSSEAAAALLNVRASWVRDAARTGHLPCLRVGRHVRFTRGMLEDWLAVQVTQSTRASRALTALPSARRGSASRRAPAAAAPSAGRGSTTTAQGTVIGHE